jgi:hypothetical protein
MLRWRSALTAPFRRCARSKATSGAHRTAAERLAACLQVPAAERPSLVKIARGERRIDGLEELSAVALPPPVKLAPFDGTTPSIAVLPFANLSDDATNEHFADG